MLFNSHIFIFVFLPVTLLIFHLLSSRGTKTQAVFALITASLVFYGWWEPKYLLLILASVAFNFLLSECLIRTAHGESSGEHANTEELSIGLRAARKALLTLGVVGNLAALAWFKYANFFVDSSNALLGTTFHLNTIILPLAISFFTFQQIAFLVDTYRGRVQERSVLRYLLFVTFFPQLIAGPIVHHKEMLPQFASALQGVQRRNLIVGGTIFFIGLFKKVIIADGVSPYSDTVFTMAANGEVLTLLESWTGALAYSVQLYFDFSGYSDMAIGLARLFGVKLPINFNSPYKASSIVEFWRRWHITLSRFLRDYLYVGLGGNRLGLSRTYINLMIVMLLGGLWHGAGWTFVFWGGLHGVYLLVNHAWRRYRSSMAIPLEQPRFLQRLLLIAARLMSHVLTLLCVVIAWVFFRAENMQVATAVLSGMAGLNGIALPTEWVHRHGELATLLSQFGVEFKQLAYMGPLFTPLRDFAILSGAQMQVDSVGTITALLSLSLPILFALFWPNTQQLMHRFEPGIGEVKSGALVSVLAWRINIPLPL